jgi:hypothetical protein
MNPDGGYPAGQAAADRVSNDIGSAGIGATSPVLLRYAPSFKSTEALAYPLVRAGAVIVAETPDGFISGTSAAPPAPGTATTLVVLCDQLFREANGADCGGPAEDPISNDAGFGGGTTLLDRFEAAPGRWMSVYGPRPT